MKEVVHASQNLRSFSRYAQNCIADFAKSVSTYRNTRVNLHSCVYCIRNRKGGRGRGALVFSISCVSGTTTMMTASRRNGTSRSSMCGYVTKMTISPLVNFVTCRKKLRTSRPRISVCPNIRARAIARHSAGETYRFAAKLNMSHFSNPYPLSRRRKRRRPDSRPRFRRRRRWQRRRRRRWRRRSPLKTCSDQNCVRTKVQRKYMK